MIHLSGSGMNGIAAKMSLIQNLLVDFVILGHNYAVVKPYYALIILSETVCFTDFHFLMNVFHTLITSHFFVHQLSFAEEPTQASSDLRFHVELSLGLNSPFLSIM